MHIPAYAHAAIRAGLPTVATPSQLRGLNCCLCDTPFLGRLPVPLGLVAESDLNACRSCLTRLVAQARQLRGIAITEEANRVGAELAAWTEKRDGYLADIDRVRQAAAAVARLAGDSGVEPARVAWLHVSLESAHTWATTGKPESSGFPDPRDISVQEAEVALFVEMMSARVAVADRLAYHLISENSPPEPEICVEIGCPEDCSGKHEVTDIDCGPDAIFEDLMEPEITRQSPQRKSAEGEMEAAP